MNPIPPEILSRKGSPTTAGVPAAVRDLLNKGLIEAVNLSEWLIIDHVSVAHHVFSSLNRPDLADAIRLALNQPNASTAPKRTAAVGAALAAACPSLRACDALTRSLIAQTSDVARTWAASLIGQHPALDLPARLSRLRPLAADHNMGVREMAWLAIRDNIAANLPDTIRLLIPWTAEPDANLRRFASEATRPRGVWCRHLAQLKADPSPGLPILEPLRSDPSKYVRDSVANWLNDASKSDPQWVRSLCARWEHESPTRETAAIIKRALRTLRKSS